MTILDRARPLDRYDLGVLRMTLDDDPSTDFTAPVVSALLLACERMDSALRLIREEAADEGSTHWDGCEDEHRWCRISKWADAALLPEMSEGDQS